MRQRKRWIAILMLAVFLALTMSSVVYAADTSLLNNQQTQAYYNNNKPSYGESFIAGILISFVKWAMNMFNLSDPVLMVFNHKPRANTSDTFMAGGVYGAIPADSLVLGIFPMQFFQAVTILYTAFQALLPIPLILMLLIMAIMHMINSGTAQGRSKIKEYAQAFIVAVVTIRFGAYIWTAIISLNEFLVKLIWAYMLQSGVKPAFFMDMIWGTGQQGFMSATAMGSLGMAILLILAAMMVLAMNYQYTMRIIILGLLIVIFPLAVTLSIFPGFRHSLQMWFKEFVANVILQLAHALALGAFFITLNMPGMNDGVSFWLMLTYFAGLPSIAGLIRELLGLQGGSSSRVMNGIGALTGIASMAAMGRMVMKRPIGQSAGGDTENGMIEHLMGSSGSSGGSGVSLSSFGGSLPLAGATSLSGKIAQTGLNAAGSIMGNKGVQTAGKFALGATAAMAGGALTSAMTGNAASGAMLGIGAGSVIGKGTGSFVGSAGGHIKGVAQTLSTGGSVKDVGQNIIAGSMQKGGVLASAGWGLQSAVNKVSSVVGKSDVFSAPSYIKGNKTMLNSASRGMQELHPQIEMAKAKYDFAKAHYGADSKEAEPAKAQYANLTTKFNEHEASAALARVRMRSYRELKNYAAEKGSGMSGSNASFSNSRGRI